jgi:hypothetical protein
MGLTIRGSVRNEEIRQGIADVIVEAYDADLFMDDLLGKSKTNARGAFSIPCPDRSANNDQPDVYLLIKTANGQLLHSTRHAVIHDVTQDLDINVSIAPAAMVKAGLAVHAEATGPDQRGVENMVDLNTWTFRPDGGLNSTPIKTVYRDLEKHGSILELFHAYKQTLDRSADNDDPVYTRLAALFNAGRTPEVVQGHFYGITLGVRCGDMPESMAEFGNLLGQIWGATLSDECPWVGKSLAPVNASRLQALTGQPAAPGMPVLLGINHFNRISTRVLNPLAFQFLNNWMDLHPAPEHERRTYHWEKNGAYFIGHQADSVCDLSPRPVFQLNYRHKALSNPVPNCWLIDELVEISPGLYLGQLCYATRKLLRDYDPQRPDQDYRYRNFGYFLLLDERWHTEARRLFPYLEIPPDAPGMRSPGIEKATASSKFSTFTFQQTPLPVCNDALKEAILDQARQYPTLLHYLKTCARALQDNPHNDSPYFQQLEELFNRGIAPQTMDGFYNGALVSWHSAGIFDLFGINTINLLYTRVAAPFSTWTGKRFDPISKEQLQEITDGHETGEIPTVWGANTQSLRTLKERFVGRLMRQADIPTEAASKEEAQQLGYDAKNFFFIARPASSIGLQSQGKPVFQFNYRWPKLETIIPDCYCIDELVQIAQGLYLGRLMYATNIIEPFDPAKDPEIYRYRNFGYFLLMDQQWQQIRLSIGFDLENV